MENHFFYGKTHYKWPFSIAMLNYQRVKHLRRTVHRNMPRTMPPRASALVRNLPQLQQLITSGEQRHTRKAEH
jgi:hypothetical protein